MILARVKTLRFIAVLWSKQTHTHSCYCRNTICFAPTCRAGQYLNAEVHSSDTSLRSGPVWWLRLLHCLRCFRLVLKSLKAETNRKNPEMNHHLITSWLSRKPHIYRPPMNQRFPLKTFKVLPCKGGRHHLIKRQQNVQFKTVSIYKHLWELWQQKWFSICAFLRESELNAVIILFK